MRGILNTIIVAVMMVGMNATDEAMRLLSIGQYKDGWADYEQRLVPANITLKKPLWDGSPCPDKTLLVRGEQGLGDVFHFMRYLPLVRERFAGRVLFRCDQRLEPLLRLSPITEPMVFGTGIDCDCQLFLMSCPHVLGLPDPADSPQPPYLLPSDPLTEVWREQLPRGFNVGIVWQGNPAFHKNHLRSFPLASFSPIAAIDDVRLVSLQQTPTDGCGFPVTEFTDLDKHAAFMDTAAILANLDLVVTCDTAIAHLAGAMGRRVWLALSTAPDWRWTLKGDSTPWYPTMRLFRQQVAGDWGEVFTRIANELRKLV